MTQSSSTTSFAKWIASVQLRMSATEFVAASSVYDWREAHAAGLMVLQAIKECEDDMRRAGHGLS